jgi:Peptidase family C25/Propeptide_C25
MSFLNKCGLLTAGLALAAGSAFAGAPNLIVKNADEHGLNVSVQTESLDFDLQKTPEGPFVNVTWTDATFAGDIGTPALPVVRRFFIVPEGAEIDLKVTFGDVQTINLASAGYDFPILPVQAPIEKLPGAIDSAPFNYNAAAYAGSAFAPGELVTISEVGIVRERHLYLLEVRPVSYNPQAGAVRLYTDIQAQLSFRGPDYVEPDINALPHLEKLVLNPDLLGQTKDVRGGNLLIVIPDTYDAACGDFCAAKSAQGFNVETYVIPSGTSATTIKNYIAGLYGGPNSPDYVLFIGDTDKIPSWTGGGDGSPQTDIAYVCMDGSGDWHPDIAYGRFPIRTTDQLQAMIDKTLLVENGPLPDPEYTTRAVFMASVDNYQISEGTHNYVIDNHMTPNGITSDKLYQVTYGADTQDVRDSFNAGRLLGVYSGHGGTYSWADGPPFSQTDVRNLTNAGMYPIVWSFACITGSYYESECFVETWVREEDAGAVAMWGSSVNSYWTEDDILEKRLFDVIYWDGVRETGPFWNATMLAYEQDMGSGGTTRRYFEMYNLMGDPTLYIPEPGGGVDMRVSPYGDFACEGLSGGPFVPDEKTYTIENTSDVPLQYQVTVDANWLGVDAPTGTIAAGNTAQVVVSLNGQAYNLGNGEYTGVISFVNQTSGSGDTTRDASLVVGVPIPVYLWNMDTNPGWSTEGLWAWGDPTGQGGDYGYADPNNGYTGTNVYGYNLNGDYENDMPQRHLTTTAIDCSNLTQVTLKFQRWLGVESPSYDHAYLHVSANGTSWTEIWQNGSSVEENSWHAMEYDISDVADEQGTVYIRWTMGTTDGSWRFCGWNIDDVEIWGLPGDLPCPEDLDGDDYVGQADLGILLAAYGVNADGDIDGDGDTDQADLGALLGMYGQNCP